MSVNNKHLPFDCIQNDNIIRKYTNSKNYNIMCKYTHSKKYNIIRKSTHSKKLNKKSTFRITVNAKNMHLSN